MNALDGCLMCSAVEGDGEPLALGELATLDAGVMRGFMAMDWLYSWSSMVAGRISEESTRGGVWDLLEEDISQRALGDDCPVHIGALYIHNRPSRYRPAERLSDRKQSSSTGAYINKGRWKNLPFGMCKNMYGCNFQLQILSLSLLGIEN